MTHTLKEIEGPTDSGHHHEWEAGSWGVIVGVSKCKQCGTTSRTEHFAALSPPPVGEQK